MGRGEEARGDELIAENEDDADFARRTGRVEGFWIASAVR